MTDPTPTPPTIEVRRRSRGGNLYTVNGQKFPGVTTLIKGGLAKDALTYWAANMAAEYAVDHPDLIEQLGRDDAYDVIRRSPWNKRDRLAATGTDIHHLAFLLSRGDEVDVPAELAAPVDQCLKFLTEHDVEVIAAERPVANVTWRYCGTFDLLANTKHGRALVDYKTGAKGPYLDDALQLAAYRHAEWIVDGNGDVLPMPPVDVCLVCKIGGDHYELIPVEADQVTFRAFLHCASTTQFVDAIGDTFAGPPL